MTSYERRVGSRGVTSGEWGEGGTSYEGEYHATNATDATSAAMGWRLGGGRIGERVWVGRRSRESRVASPSAFAFVGCGPRFPLWGRGGFPRVFVRPLGPLIDTGATGGDPHSGSRASPCLAQRKVRSQSGFGAGRLPGGLRRTGGMGFLRPASAVDKRRPNKAGTLIERPGGRV